MIEKLLRVTSGRPLVGEVDLPGDKSLSHRAALLAALAEGESRIENFLVSGVTDAMLNALRKLGVEWKLDGTTLVVQGAGLQLERSLAGDRPFSSTLAIGSSEIVLDCGNSATTLRLLAGALAAWNIPAVLDGSPGLRRRPMGRVVEPLRQMGVQIAAVDGRPPLHILPVRALPPSVAVSKSHKDDERSAIQSKDTYPISEGASHLKGGRIVLPVASAQVKSCLLLAGLAADEPLVVVEPGPSRDHTERMLQEMGVIVETEYDPASPACTIRLSPPAASLCPLRMRLPGDFSSAAFIIVAGLITPGSHLLIHGVGLNPTRTGLMDVLQEMGADLKVIPGPDQGGEPAGDILVRYSRLHGGMVSGERVVRMIDEFPVFAAAAACAAGTTVISEANELRHKESDRIAALGGELCRLGVDYTETADGFSIKGGNRLHSAEIDPHGDHRLAMTAAVLGLALPDGETTVVRQAEIIGESFPEFVSVLNCLGAGIAEISGEATH